MKKYRFIFLILFIIEVAIAIFHFHPFVRGFIGDVFVIALIYFGIRSLFINVSEKILAWIVLFAFVIEFLQLLKISETLGIQSPFLRLILGSTFDAWDLVAYGIGALLSILIEKYMITKTGLIS